MFDNKYLYTIIHVYYVIDRLIYFLYYVFACIQCRKQKTASTRFLRRNFTVYSVTCNLIVSN